jgi:hypothetical protein
MLKAKEITALAMPLRGGRQAVLLQEGDEWNGLTKFKCIAPHECVGLHVIAAKPSTESLAAAFEEIFGAIRGTATHDDWTIIMAPPGIAERLEPSGQIPAATSAAVSL